MKIYIIPGEPIPLSRPRFSTLSKRVYNPIRNIMLSISITLQSQHNDEPLFEGPIKIDIVFYMPISKKITPKNKLKMIGTFHSFRPDLDNLCKLVADVGNGVLFKDDCIIASISAKKVYDINPRTEFTIQSL